MIANLFLNIISNFLIWIVDLYPQMETIPSAFDSSVNFLMPFFNMADSVFPISTVFQIFLLYLTIESGLLIFKLFNFLFNKFRGSG